LKIAIFANCILLVDGWQRNAQQYQRVLYTAEKYIHWLQFRRWQYGSTLMHGAVFASQITKSREILRKLKLIAVQGHPRLSILGQSKAHMQLPI